MPQPVRPIKVLVIDDSLDFYLLIKTYLEESGIRCLAATDVVQATSTAVREQPNLILLDIGLPGGGACCSSKGSEPTFAPQRFRLLW